MTLKEERLGRTKSVLKERVALSSAAARAAAACDAASWSTTAGRRGASRRVPPEWCASFKSA